MEQMQARAVLAALTAAMLMAAPAAHAQSGAGGTARGQAERACSGDCPEQRAEAMRELAKSRAELARLARLFAQQGDSLDAQQLAQARRQLLATVERIERLERDVTRDAPSARRFMVARVQAPPPTVVQSGWLGVSFSSNFEITERDSGPRNSHFREYPVVEAVEPASPARRAGIEVGDVLLAFQQKDLRAEPIELDRMLTPGNRLSVLLKRDARTRTVTVVVGERPQGAYAVVAPVPAPPAPPSVRVGSVPRGTMAVPAPAAAPEPPGWAYAWSSESMSMAGAQMARLPAELREQVGAEGGLLVLRVAHGTPAARAGLRDGDVIVRANGQPVRSSGDLQVAFRRAEERALSLQVVRQRETMTVRMVW
jgi:membrane-associated protease RseP (regulator of RpoE activity)